MYKRQALIRLASHHVLNALTNVDEEQMKEVPIEKLIKETNGLIRAAAYKLSLIHIFR